MTMTRKLLVPLALAAITLASQSALAAFTGSANAPFQALAHVDPTCTISVAGNLDFGAYDPIGANASAALTGSTSLSITCSRGTVSSIDLSSSVNFGAGIAGKRAMTTGGGGAGNVLSYDLFQPSALGGAATATTTPWGDGTTAGASLAVAAAPSIAPRTVLVFGSIPAAQDASTGPYSDNVTATINF
jgi:spore coat protein U-like protein